MEKLHLKDYATLGNALFGFLAIVLVALQKTNYWGGVVLVLAAVVMDILDGKIARYTLKENWIGKELDSLADVISFGVAPALILLAPVVFVSQELFIVTLLGAVVYVACGIIRLARFNIQAEKKVFYGLPIPVAAILLLLLAPFMMQYYFILFFILGYAMIGQFRIPKVI